VNAGQFDHGGKVGRGLLEASGNSSGFLEPSDQIFDDVSFLVFDLVEIYEPLASVLILLARNHGTYSTRQQMLIDPQRSIAFVSRE